MIYYLQRIIQHKISSYYQAKIKKKKYEQIINKNEYFLYYLNNQEKKNLFNSLKQYVVYIENDSYFYDSRLNEDFNEFFFYYKELRVENRCIRIDYLDIEYDDIIKIGSTIIDEYEQHELFITMNGNYILSSSYDGALPADIVDADYTSIYDYLLEEIGKVYEIDLEEHYNNNK